LHVLRPTGLKIEDNQKNVDKPLRAGEWEGYARAVALIQAGRNVGCRPSGSNSSNACSSAIVAAFIRVEIRTICGGSAPSRRAWSRLLLARWNVIRRQRCALSKEVLLHLLEEEFLSLWSTKIQTVLVHEHLHVLHPHSPRLFRDVVVDPPPQRMAFERNFLQSFHLVLELDAKNAPCAFRNRLRLIEVRRNTTTHRVRIAVGRPGHVMMNNSSG
jgi:hypothetical protein